MTAERWTWTEQEWLWEQARPATLALLVGELEQARARGTTVQDLPRLTALAMHHSPQTAHVLRASYAPLVEVTDLVSSDDEALRTALAERTDLNRDIAERLLLDQAQRVVQVLLDNHSADLDLEVAAFALVWRDDPVLSDCLGRRTAALRPDVRPVSPPCDRDCSLDQWCATCDHNPHLKRPLTPEHARRLVSRIVDSPAGEELAQQVRRALARPLGKPIRPDDTVLQMPWQVLHGLHLIAPDEVTPEMVVRVTEDPRERAAALQALDPAVVIDMAYEHSHLFDQDDVLMLVPEQYRLDLALALLDNWHGSSMSGPSWYDTPARLTASPWCTDAVGWAVLERGDDHPLAVRALLDNDAVGDSVRLTALRAWGDLDHGTRGLLSAQKARTVGRLLVRLVDDADNRAAIATALDDGWPQLLELMDEDGEDGVRQHVERLAHERSVPDAVAAVIAALIPTVRPAWGTLAEATAEAVRAGLGQWTAGRAEGLLRDWLTLHLWDEVLQEGCQRAQEVPA